MRNKVLIALIFTLFLTNLSYAEETVVFGPEEFKGRLFVPKTTIANFPIADTSGEFTLIIENGIEFIPQDCSLEPTNRLKRRCQFRNFFNKLKAHFTKAIDAEIILNDELIVEMGEINKHVDYLEVPVDVQEDNELEVTVRGLRKSFLQLTILQEGSVDPCVAILGANECPCDYERIPKTTACWSTATFKRCTTDNCDTPPDDCNVTSTRDMNSPSNAVAVVDPPVGYACGSIAPPSAGFGPCDSSTNELETGLTQEESDACQCRLEQYTKELIQAGIVVVELGGMTPLEPDDISCSPPE